LGVVDVSGTAYRVDKPKLCASHQFPLSQHRHQRHDARSASDQQNLGLLGRPPNKPPADGSAKFDLLAGAYCQEIRRDLTVGNLLHGDLDVLTVGRSTQ
jgi:hypothetical protein